MELKFKIFRFDPQMDKGPYFKHYTVRAEPEERILDCLNRIKWEQDGTLSYRMSCGHGVCGSDGMKISGTCRLACQALVKDYQCLPEVVVEPLPVFRVLKDLVVDIEPFLEGIKLLQPHLNSDAPPPEKERIQSPEDRKKLSEVIRCILCACCTASCPVNWISKKYVGPAALVWAHRFIFESRDGNGVCAPSPEPGQRALCDSTAIAGQNVPDGRQFRQIFRVRSAVGKHRHPGMSRAAHILFW